MEIATVQRHPPRPMRLIASDDGGSRDPGYPCATVLADGLVLAVCYLNQHEGTRSIAGTLLDPEG